MGRLGNLLKKDFILGIKDIFIILELVFAVFIVIFLLFIVPEDLENEGMVYIWDQTDVIRNFIDENIGEEEMEEIGEFYVESREALVEGMVENKSALGLIISQEGDGYLVQLFTQPYTNERTVEYIYLDLEDLLSILHPPYGVYPADVYDSVRIEALEWGARDDLPFNRMILPMILMMMVGVIGMFAMVSLVGQERSDLTLRAYRISPGTLIEFLTSKFIVLQLTGTATFSIIYLPMMGFDGYLASLAVIELTILFGTAIGTFLGSFFRNPMAAMLWVLFLMILLSLPAISLLAPVFSPGWLKLIPSYYAMFGMDAAMFPEASTGSVGMSCLILGAIDVVLIPISGLVFSSRVGKEG